jgi:hypothetical protein
VVIWPKLQGKVDISTTFDEHVQGGDRLLPCEKQKDFDPIQDLLVDSYISWIHKFVTRQQDVE